MRGMGQGLSDHFVVLCKIKLVRYINKNEKVNGTGRIKNENYKLLLLIIMNGNRKLFLKEVSNAKGGIVAAE